MFPNNTWRRHLWSNRIHTLLLILLLLAISSLAGGLLLGEMGLWLAVGGAIFALFVEPIAAWRMTLSLYRARPIYPEEAPDLWRITRTLASRAELPSTPVLYYIPSPVVNAFTVGHGNHAAIALTDGLLSRLTLRELTGVLGHEMAHIANGDLLVMGLADYISRLTNLFSVGGQLMLLFSLPLLFIEGYAVSLNLFSMLLLLFSPHLAILAQLGLSRVREYDADLKASTLTGDPMGLAFALARIEQTSRSWIEILLPGWGNPQPSWLRSHPATEERIKRLQEQAATFYLSLDSLSASDHPIGYITKAIQRQPRWRAGGFWY
ncbi:M48 family metalloprotease [Methylomonas sp. LL1]|uniref:zinc metalloprotease HtpX n=1 Tax=Methylomonas sp. LL1 TaxID=2785785 RepID=UPI0018C417BB|nr:zinc metalloprotease HtpX [Methylomonas sp. LL1]QPK62363.1 M48 family metalloprotease [Methylomonas sp. LL1]